MNAFIRQMDLPAKLLALFSVILFILLNVCVDFFAELYEPIRSNHVANHLIMELISIFVSLSIALHGWVSFKSTLSLNWLMFSSAFVAVALLDLVHALTFRGMPHFIFDSSSSTTAWFWVAARLTESIMFMLVILFPLKGRASLNFRKHAYQLACLYTLVISIFIFAFYPYLPVLISEQGPTPLKNGAEYFFIVIHAAVLIKTVSGGRSGDFIDIPLASFYLILSSWLLTSYEVLDEYRNIAGHVFKVFGYYYLMKLMYKAKIEKPYLDLIDLSAKHKLLLNSVAEGIYGMDKDGKATFINESALRMLGYTKREVLGSDIHRLIHHHQDGTLLRQDQCIAWQTSQDGQPRVSGDEYFFRKDGTSFPVLMKAKPMIEQDVQSGTVVTFTDISLEKELDMLQKEKKDLDLELDLAVKLQESLNPQQKKWKNREDIGAVSVAFRTLNGDFYSIIPRDDLVMMAIADISGKGVPAAIQKSMMVYALEDFNSRHEQPHDVLGSLNTFVHEYTSDYAFVTMTMANYHKTSRVFSFSTGGHEPALWYQASTGEFIELHTRNPALGLLLESVYTTQSVTLEPGDLIMLYTDGVTECKDKEAADGNMLLREALLRADHSLPSENIAQQVLDEINVLRPCEVHDDQSIVILKA
jgi:phosphoserine phosphatase RsbU/P